MKMKLCFLMTLLLLLATQICAAELPAIAQDNIENLKLFIDFDEEVVDTSPLNHTLSIENISFSMDVSHETNTAAFFDGSAYMNINSSRWSFNDTNEFTVLLWVNFTDSITYYNNFIFANRGTPFFMGLMPNGRIRAFVRRTGSTNPNNYLYSDESKVVPFNRWTNIAFTYKNGNASIYINGKLVGTDNFDGILQTSSPTNLVLGTSAFKGALDDVMIFNKALSNTQLFDYYKSVDRPLPPHCIDDDNDGYYLYEDCEVPELDCDNTNPSFHPNAQEYCNLLDENCNGINDDNCIPEEKTEATDFSDYTVGKWSFEGTVEDQSGINNCTAYNPNYVIGKVGNAIRFDNAIQNSYVDCGINDLLNTQDQTISFWAKHDLSTVGVPIINRGAYSTNGYRIIWRDAWLDFYHYGTEYTQEHTDFGVGYGTHNADEWYHLVISINSSEGEYGTARLYNNGQLWGTHVFANPLVLESRNLYFGTAGPWAQRWSGELDELLILNKSLTSSEIYNLYRLMINSRIIETNTGSIYNKGYINFTIEYKDINFNQIDNGVCTITFRNQSDFLRNSFLESETLVFNPTSETYTLSKYFNEFGDYEYKIKCSAPEYSTAESFGTVSVSGVTDLYPLDNSEELTNVLFSGAIISHKDIESVSLLIDSLGSGSLEVYDTIHYSGDSKDIRPEFSVTFNDGSEISWAYEYSDGTNTIRTETRTINTNQNLCVDSDNDGYGVYPNAGKLKGCTFDGSDCDDNNPTVHPFRTDICGDGIDNNCKLGIDETCNAVSEFDGWRAYPIRTQEEYEAGEIGGEAEQHNQGMARSRSDPNTVYLSHDCGQMWRSRDGGDSWEHPMSRGLNMFAGQSIEVDPVDPERVFIVIDSVWNAMHEAYSGVYKSENGGDDWEFVLPTNATDHNRRYEHNLAYDLTSIEDGHAQEWYVAFWDDALYRSDDEGNNWNQVSSLNGFGRIFQIQTHPSDGVSVFVASEEGLFVSHEDGANLVPLGNLPDGQVTSIQINEFDPNIIYATVEGQDLYKSIDGGNTFTSIKDTEAKSVFINPGYPNVIYLISNQNDIMTSNDSGETWFENPVMRTKVGTQRTGWGYSIQGNMAAVMPNINDPNEAVGFGEAKIHKTTDQGQNFYDSSTMWTGFNCNGDMAFDPFNKDRFAIFNADVGTYITENNGDYFENRGYPWDWIESDLLPWASSYAGAIQPIEGSDLLVTVGGYVFNRRIITSNDFGENWVPKSELSRTNIFVAFNPYDPNTIYAGNKISRDGGITFEDMDNGYDDEIVIYGMCNANPDIIYGIGRYNSMIFRSDDKGMTWYVYHDQESGITFSRHDSFVTFAVDPIDCDKVYSLGPNADLAVFNKTGWRELHVLEKVNSTMPNFVRSVAVDPNNNSIIYASLWASGEENIFRSLDAGETWESIDYNKPYMHMGISVNPNSGELIAGGCVGTWIFPPPYAYSNSLYENAETRASCHDGLMNGEEEGIDCGGYCSQVCNENSNEKPFAINLYSGWNFISFPIKFADKSMNEVSKLLGNNEFSICEYTNDESNIWSCFHSNLPAAIGNQINTLTSLNSEKAYFVKVQNQTDLTVRGSYKNGNLTINLAKGFNAFSNPNRIVHSKEFVFDELLENFYGIYKYVNDGIQEGFVAWLNLPNHDYLGDLSAGNGYFINSKKDINITIEVKSDMFCNIWQNELSDDEICTSILMEDNSENFEICQNYIPPNVGDLPSSIRVSWTSEPECDVMDYE